MSETHHIEWNIVVPHNIYGPRMRYDYPFRNVVGIMINVVLQGRPQMIYGTGEQRCCFSYVADDVPALVDVALRKEIVSEVINIGPDDEFVSINELAQAIALVCNTKVTPIYVPARPREVALANCSAEKARRLLGYAPSHSLDGRRATAEWMRRRGPLPFRYDFPLEIVSDETPRTWTERRF